jgi:hypothetical protein
MARNAVVAWRVLGKVGIPLARMKAQRREVPQTERARNRTILID